MAGGRTAFDCAMNCLHVTGALFAAAWSHAVLVFLIPALFGGVFNVSQLLAGTPMIQHIGFVGAVAVWGVCLVSAVVLFARRRVGGGLAAITALLVFVTVSHVLGRFDEDILAVLDLTEFEARRDELEEAVRRQPGQYGDNSDIYTAPERTLAEHQDFSALGKLVVFQTGAIPGWWRLIVYDESDQVGNPATQQRHLNRTCARRQGWEYGDPVLCTTNSDGQLLGEERNEIKARRLDGHFYVVYIRD